MNEEYIKKIITDETIRAFEGEISFIKFQKNIPYGPFYRVDHGNMANEIKNAEINNYTTDKILSDLIQTNKELTPNIDHLKKLRSNKLEDFVNNNVCGTRKSLALSFIETHREDIELDARYNLLSKFKMLLSNKYDDLIDKCWHEKSPGRWCGPDEVISLKDAHEKYYLPHLLFPDCIDSKRKYLFKFYFNLVDDKYDKAGIFFGKTYLGKSIQFKYNNDATDCIANLNCIGILSLNGIIK